MVVAGEKADFPRGCADFAAKSGFCFLSSFRAGIVGTGSRRPRPESHLQKSVFLGLLS